MRRLALGAIALAAASSCARQPPPARTGNAEVDAFLADIAAGRREAAIARVYSMESASGEPNAVATPAAFVDKLLQCTYVSVRQRTARLTMYDINWRCPDGDYRSLIDPNWRPPRLTIGQFDTVAKLDAWRTNPRAPPPAVMLPPHPPQRPGQ